MRLKIAALLSRRDVVFLMICACLLMTTVLSLRTAQEPLDSKELPTHSVADDYERGFISGYRAFRQQSEEHLPSEQYTSAASSHLYSSSHWSDLETRGYVDGYHKAAKMQHCPVDEQD